MIIRCSDCKEYKDDKEINIILGVYVCNKCYPKGNFYSDKNYEIICKERLEDFFYIDDVDEVFKILIKNCCVDFGHARLICKGCLCYEKCKKQHMPKKCAKKADNKKLF